MPFVKSHLSLLKNPSVSFFLINGLLGKLANDEDMHNQMQSCDILLFKAEESIFSKIIAWGTNSKYSHVAVCVYPEMNLAIEAMTRGGVQARDIRKIKAHYVTKFLSVET